MPGYDIVHIDSTEYSDLIPTQFRADAVVVLRARGEPVFAVIVEVQLGRDVAKRWSWPVYIATLRARKRCPVALMVVCVDPVIAQWCAAPIDLGHPRLVLWPLVLGPDRVPAVTDPYLAARSPELAVLSALAHPDRTDVLDALPRAFAAADPAHLGLYSDVVMAALPEAARKYLEALVGIGTYQYQSEFVRKYISHGEATILLKVLKARGISISAEIRDRIVECTDPAQIEAWGESAATAESADEIFG
jgi:hypothetical protein